MSGLVAAGGRWATGRCYWRRDMLVGGWSQPCRPGGAWGDVTLPVRRRQTSERRGRTMSLRARDTEWVSTVARFDTLNYLYASLCRTYGAISQGSIGTTCACVRHARNGSSGMFNDRNREVRRLFLTLGLKKLRRDWRKNRVAEPSLADLITKMIFRK